MRTRTNLKIWLVMAVILLRFGCTIAAGDVIYVDVDANGANDGSRWEDAFNHLQDALDVSSSGDMIRVAEGVYKPDEDTAHPDGTGNREATFQLKNGVAIYGGFPPGGGNWEDRDPNDPNNETILSGDLNGDDGPDFANNNENSYHIIIGSWTDSTAILDGFTITAGKADYGGGMYNDSGSPTLTNCTFTGNSSSDGGGICNENYSNPTLTDCTFTGNLAYNDGGGMYNSDSDPNISNCTFTGNFAEWEGGGMFNAYSSPTLTNCKFSGNEAHSDGGGMSNMFNSSPTLTNCTFSGNSSPSGGGGMSNWESSLTLNNCTFSKNSASYGGGMFNVCSGQMVYNSILTLTNCTFSGNEAGYGGGMTSVWGSGQMVYNSSLTLTNCTFSENEAVSGGGMSNDYGSPTVTNCTFSENSADEAGGGIFSEYSNPKLTNCLFSSNSASSRGGGMYNTESDTTLTNCTFTGNSAGDDGGGICNRHDSNSTVLDCTFGGNSAVEDGGGISCEDSTLIITNNTIAGNAAGDDGGGIYCKNSDVSILGSNITANACHDNGGGIYWRDCSLMITNNVITGNTADDGGGMWGRGEFSPAITNNTISGNTAVDDGGGICCRWGCSPVITNSILWGNTADNGAEIRLKDDSTLTVTYSDVQGGWPGEGNIEADPLFVDADGNDYHVVPGSPCVDAGDNTAVPADIHDLDGDGNTTEPIPWDLDGNPRIVDGNDDGNSVVDMGAYELLSPHQLVINRIKEAIAEKEEALQKINTALEKEVEAYEILGQLLKSGDYGDWSREAILGARWKISIAIFYEEDYIKKVLEKNIDKLQRTLSVLGVETNGGNDDDIPVPSAGAYEAAVLSLHQLVINLIEEALAEKAEALERIDSALQKERQAHETLEQMLINRDYGDWNKQAILRAKSRIYVAIKYEEYLKKVLMIMTVDKLEDSLSVLGIEAYDGSH